jgi:hypothetical protein
VGCVPRQEMPCWSPSCPAPPTAGPAGWIAPGTTFAPQRPPASGKKLPVRGLGIGSTRSPAVLDSVRARAHLVGQMAVFRPGQ